MDTYYWDLAARQFASKATEAEQRELQQWRAAQPANETQYQQQKQLWEKTAPPISGVVNIDAAWQQVSAKLQLQLATEPLPVAKVIPLYSYAMRIAASVLVLLGLGWFTYTYFFSGPAMQVVKSGKKRLEVLLPDSSRVWLNEGSTLTYAATFSAAERLVQLEGEGFFKVRRNPRQPFIVKTGLATTKVLGTSFNLRAYKADRAVELTVATGKVAFTSERGAEAIVTPGYGVVLEKQNNRLTKGRVADENAWAWQSGRLRFAGQPLSEVLPALEHYYGVSLRLSDKNLANCRFTGTFDHAPLDEVLQVLEATLQVRYTKPAAQVYQLQGPGCLNR
ncbi:FecR family protein [Hymenobacter roseosalivarius DSM 11622]|uniref:FecR family protein n=1 Tax=Hymenobacter roseosalivarius DSM 11622 TaxID=645990 RepID=A0A1W1US62_9BACT|nr:FecR domain-containing protein [Hymenobacter roseosalivarius]SMB83876.1 FecR family protein [Hymenobacter roseosalivarius DSM 11622]